MSMINWGYIAPRVILVAAVWLLIALGLDPLARWVIIRMSQRATGSKVEVGRVATSLSSGQIELENVRVTNPLSSKKDLLQAKYMRLDLDTAALGRQHLVVTEGVIQGLTINSPGDDSGKAQHIDWIDAELADSAKDWLETAAKALGANLVEDLESVRLARELAQRWPQEYKDLEARADRWIEQIRELQKLPEVVKKDPLASAQQLQKAALTLKSLQAELTAMRTEFQRLHQQARIDKTGLADAAARDVEKLKLRLQLAKLDSEALSNYLLGEQLAPHARQAITWLTWVRANTPSSDLPQPKRGRGTDVLLSPAAPEPWLLARSLHVDGTIVHGDHSYPFIAQAQGLTSEPRTYGQPAVLRMKLAEPTECWVELTIDRTGPRRVDRIAIHCPRVPMNEVSLGDAEYLALAMPAGTIAMTAQLELAEEQLTAAFRVSRAEPALQLRLGEKLGDNKLGVDSLAGGIQHQLNAIAQLEAALSIEGTLARPQMRLQSPIGAQLRDAVHGALLAEIQSRSAALQVQARTALDQEIAGIEKQLAVHKQSVLKKLNVADEQQKQIEKLVARSFGVPKERLGRELLRVLERR